MSSTLKVPTRTFSSRTTKGISVRISYWANNHKLQPNLFTSSLRMVCPLSIFIFISLAAVAQPWSAASYLLQYNIAGTSVTQRCDVAQRGSAWIKERSVGNQLAAALEPQLTLISDASILNYLNGLEQTILLASDLQGCYVVKLIKDNEVNAYSLPGGFLYVTSGLILNANSEAQLVGALSHETGHVTARHFTRIVSRTRTWKKLALAGGPAGYALWWRLGPFVTVKLIRNAELQADRSAVQYEIASGYDPMEFCQLLWNQFQHGEEPASLLGRLLESHPSTATRLQGIQRSIAAHSRLPEYVVDQSEFHDVKSSLADLIRAADGDPIRPQSPTNSK